MAEPNTTNTVKKATLVMANDDLHRQEVQVTGYYGEVFSKVEHYQPYGLSAVANPSGGSQLSAEGILLSPTGNSSNNILIALDDRRKRPKGQPAGTVSLYGNMDTQDAATAVDATHRITLEPTGNITIKAGTTSLTMNPTDNSVVGISTEKFKWTTDPADFEMTPARIFTTLGSASIEVLPSQITLTVGSTSLIVTDGNVVLTSGSYAMNVSGTITMAGAAGVNVSGAVINLN